MRLIYSQLPLATREPLRESLSRCLELICQRTVDAGGGNRTRCLLITSQLLYQVSYASMGRQQAPACEGCE